MLANFAVWFRMLPFTTRIASKLLEIKLEWDCYGLTRLDKMRNE